MTDSKNRHILSPMLMKRLNLLTKAGFAVFAGIFLGIGGANAAVLVHVIQNDTTPGNASIVPPSTLPSADFNSPDINFNTNNSDATSLFTWLNSPVFFNLQNGFNASLAADNTFLEITGQTFLNAGVNSFVVGHDDGVVLTFATLGIVVNQPGPTGFVTTPFNVTAPAAGLYAFDLKYTECCGGPANLVFQINGAPVGETPEPATMALAATGLAAVLLVGRLKMVRPRV